jgi:hypothetical protein
MLYLCQNLSSTWTFTSLLSLCQSLSNTRSSIWTFYKHIILMSKFVKHPDQALGPFTNMLSLCQSLIVKHPRSSTWTFYKHVILISEFVNHLDQTFGPFPNTSCFDVSLLNTRTWILHWFPNTLSFVKVW